MKWIMRQWEVAGGMGRAEQGELAARPHCGPVAACSPVLAETAVAIRTARAGQGCSNAAAILGKAGYGDQVPVSHINPPCWRISPLAGDVSGDRGGRVCYDGLPRYAMAIMTDSGWRDPMCGLPVSFVVFGTAVLVSIFEMIGLSNQWLGIGGGLMLAMVAMGGIAAVSSRKPRRPHSFEP